MTMNYEGEHTIIPIHGIKRAGADSMVEDGAMNEVIGMEYQDGSFVPYIPEEISHAKYPQGTKKIYVHQTSLQDNVIIICDLNGNNENQVMWISKENFDNGTYNSDDQLFGFHLIEGLAGVNEIEFIGNMIIDNTKKTFIFKYNKYDEILFEIDSIDLPQVQLKVRCDYEWESKAELSEFGSGRRIFNGVDYSKSIGSINNMGDDNESFRSSVAGYMQRCIGQWTELGGLTGWCIATVAYRLTNGEYILASQPIVLAEPYVKNREGNIIYNGQIIANVYEDSVVLIPKEFVSKFDTNYGIQTHRYPNNSDNKADITFIDDDNYIVVKKKGDEDHHIYENKVESPMFAAFGETNNCLQMSIVHSNILEFFINKDIDKKYESTIESVCIFLSKQVSGYKSLEAKNIKGTGQLGITYTSNKDGIHFTQFAGGYWVYMKDIPDILDELKGIDLLYKVHEIPFVEITKSSEWVKVDLRGKLGDNLLVQDILNINSFNNSQERGSLFTYNNRIHLFNYSQLPSAIYDIRGLSTIGGYGQYDTDKLKTYRWRIIAKCNNSLWGEYTLDTGGYIPGGTYISFSPLITYPNTDAYEIEFRFEFNNVNFRRVFKMIPNKKMGLAVNWKEDLKPYVYDKDFEIINSGDALDVEQNNVLFNYPNGIKVSDTSYLYFPPEQTYLIGKGRIKGLAVLSIALSQDTFGKYPLLVFCTDGIYSMGINTSGTGAYEGIIPFSREVCVNKNTICEIDGAVLFATDKGLMIATQQGIQEFCHDLNGIPQNLPHEDRSFGTGLYVYGNAIKNEKLIKLEDDLSTLNVVSNNDFIDYLQDENTYISYVSKKNKVIIYNAQKKYVYWIDIPTRVVTKLNLRISFGNNNYPKEEYYDYGKTAYQFAYRSNEKENANCLLQTRPIKLSSQLKSNYRIVVRGYFNSILNVDIEYSGTVPFECTEHPIALMDALNYEDDVLIYKNTGHYYGWFRKSNNENVYLEYIYDISFPVSSKQPQIGDEISVTFDKNYAGLYVLGSLDSNHWQLIGAKEKRLTPNGFHDLGCIIERVSVKYLMVILVGKLTPNSHIDRIEITSNNKYNNKLK